MSVLLRQGRFPYRPTMLVVLAFDPFHTCNSPNWHAYYHYVASSPCPLQATGHKSKLIRYSLSLAPTSFLLSVQVLKNAFTCGAISLPAEVPCYVPGLVETGPELMAHDAVNDTGSSMQLQVDAWHNHSHCRPLSLSQPQVIHATYSPA